MMQTRPHHLLCLLDYIQKDDSIFSNNFFAMSQQLKKNPNIAVELIEGADDICIKCPSLTKDKICIHPNDPIPQDAKVLKAFTLQIGTKIPYKNFVKIIKAKATKEVLVHTCEGCDEKTMTHCHKAWLG